MLSTAVLRLVLALAVPSLAAAQVPDAKPAAAAPTTHGKLDWFRGSYDELLAAARKANKPIFMDFWTTWCGWCKKLDSDTFSDPAVVEAMSGFLCYSVDAEQTDLSAGIDGVRLAQRYGVRGYPYLVFAEPTGELRDRISGYLAPADFLREVQRIQSGENTLSDLVERVQLEPANLFLRGELMVRFAQFNDVAASQREAAELRTRVQRGEGFDPQSPYERWRVSQLLRNAGDEAGANAQLDAIRQFGEPGVRWLERRAALDTAVATVNRAYQTEKKLDAAPIAAFIAEEKRPELLYEAWIARRNMENFTANERRKENNAQDEARARSASRAAAREAWKQCPERFKNDVARELVSAWVLDAAALGAQDKAFAVEVARWAAEKAPRDPSRLDLLGQALQMLGHHDQAVSAFERALELGPQRMGTRTRLAAARAALAPK
ncbi:MAG: thioredoxin fold domain-containing protein [Planctomycetes bacterium]|nr:thioredoxin fold domain-containing protein [Planctomycetota bacterium]